MYVSALSVPELTPGFAPWWPEIDASRLVVVDANVGRVIDRLRRGRGPRTYDRRAAWLISVALRGGWVWAAGGISLAMVAAGTGLMAIDERAHLLGNVDQRPQLEGVAVRVSQPDGAAVRTQQVHGCSHDPM